MEVELSKYRKAKILLTKSQREHKRIIKTLKAEVADQAIELGQMDSMRAQISQLTVKL